MGDSVIPPKLVMDMMTQAGGVAPSSGPSVVRGYATGQDSTEWLTQHGVRITAHQWVYGNEGSRKQPFPPHRNLDGEEFSDWDDERLTTPASASWLSVGHMFPGDHFRCQCSTVPVVLEESTANAAVSGPRLIDGTPSQVGRGRGGPSRLPSYVNRRPDAQTLNMEKAVGRMSPQQMRATQEAFDLVDRRFPGALDELQEVSVSSDITAFATKSRWQVIFNESHLSNVGTVRQNWASVANSPVPGQIATKAGGALDDAVYLRNVAVHEMSHIAEHRFRDLASPSQIDRLDDLFKKMQADHSVGTTLENPFESMPSLYADENAGEFFAEALSDAIIGDSPNRSSTALAKLFDEVFG